MTIDEAIKYCLEVAEHNEALIKRGYAGGCNSHDCSERAENHRQFAKWLTELKELREQNVELKRILNGALKDMRGKDILEVMNLCKLCAMKFQQLCDVFPWQYADEALKLIGDESNGS